jgi:hypothetical protein
MMRKQKNTTSRRSHTPRIGAREGIIPHPPPAVTTLTHKGRLRFISNAAFAGNITWQNLLDAVNVSTSATTANDLFWMVRVKRVQIWCNGLTNTTQTIELSFTGTVNGLIGDEKMHSDMSMGIEPAYVDARPDPKSQAAQFQTAYSTPAWFMDIPAASVIDVTVEYRNNFVGAAPAVLAPPVGATAGQVCLRGLDGLAFASTKFPPVGSTNVN